jgi:hypothetical protein
MHSHVHPWLQVRALRFIAMFGYTAGELEGDNITLFYSAEHDLRRSQGSDR